MNTDPILVQVLLKATPAQAWRVYTQPEHIVKWNFASDDWHCPHAENDLRIGGKYLARMEAKDGSMGFDFEAIYDEIIPEQRIVYRLSDGRKVEIDFQEREALTELSVTFDPDQQAPREMQEQGWQAILNNYQKQVERQ